MSYTTKVIYSTDSQFANTQNVTKSGKPNSVELKNLTSNKNYYTKAELMDNNGTLLDTSDVSTFKTLAAGTISLSYVSTTRNGNNYIASYTYTSTYALSSAIMSINSINVQGVIAGNNITFTINGLTHGNTYSYTITATDIYTETETTSGSITIPHDYSQDYFTIKNESDTLNNIYLGPRNSNNYKSITVYVSTDNGATWNAKTTGQNGVILATLEQGKSLLVKHTGALSYDVQINQFRSNGNYSVSGNIASLCFGDNFNTGSALTMPDYAYDSLFSYNVNNQEEKLISAENLDFSSYTAVSTYGMSRMFRSCTSLKTAPDLSNITSVDVYGMYEMFLDCTSLKTAPDLSNITSVLYNGMGYMFRNCTSLTTMPDLSNVVSVGNSGMSAMFQDCTSLTTAPDLSSITSVDVYGMAGMFRDCTSLETPPDLRSITSVGSSGMSAMFYGCTSLKAAPDLSSITSVGHSGMNSMFSSCTSLETPPDLSSITSVVSFGMHSMFNGCTSLTTMPDLSNVVSVGTSGMENIFYNCDSLVNVSDFDSLTTVEQYGFQNAFGSCDSLETAPNFNSVTTVGAHAFDQLFTWDGNLKSASGFDSLTTVFDYTFSAAYYNCTSLKTGSDIRRITAASRIAFSSMYLGCSSLSKAYAPTITWDTSKTNNWLSGVYSTGELYADPSIASGIPTSNASGCPAGWTVETAVILQAPSITFDRGDVVLTATILQGSNAYIRYKKNNDANWIKYLTPISVAPNDIIYAQNYTETSGYEPSTVVSETFATMQLNAPVITYDASTEYVTISDTNDAFANSGIYYTTDGTTPTSRSTLYETPFQEQAGVTVKAIVIPKNTTWYTDSNVTSKVTSKVAVKKLSYIHNDSMYSNAQLNVAIDTDIVMNNTIKFIYVGKYAGYLTGNVIVGNSTGDDNNDLRMFSPFGNTLYLDWGSSRQSSSYTFSNVDDIDITGGNYYLYDNGASSYIFNKSQANYSANDTLVVDCSSYWLKSLQIWKTINNVETLVFDGYAAEYEGECGLWDEVSQKLFTNSNITIVGEE